MIDNLIYGIIFSVSFYSTTKIINYTINIWDWVFNKPKIEQIVIEQMKDMNINMEKINITLEKIIQNINN